MKPELKDRLLLRNHCLILSQAEIARGTMATRYLLALALFFIAINRSSAQTQASAAIKDGTTLMEVCKESEKPTFNQMLNFAMCTGYLSGVVDSEDVAQAAIKNANQQDKRSLRFCLDERVTNGQLRAVINKFLEERPELRHLPAAIVVQSALARSFPCKESN